MKKLVLTTTALMLGVAAANAFLYASEDATWWDLGTTGDWMTEANWTDYGTGSDWRIAGWVAGNPENTGGSTDPLWNEGYACIDRGTVNITPTSRPDGIVERAYIGSSTGTSVLNVGADASFGRFLVGWDPSEIGTVNLTAGTMNVNDPINFRIGANNGSGNLNVSGGTLNAVDRLTFGYGAGTAGDMVLSGGVVNVGRVIMAYNNTSTSSLEISGGVFDASGYLSLEDGTGTMTVNGSSSTISMDRFAIKAAEGHTLNLGLDAGGVTTIFVNGDIAGSGDAYEGATLNDLAIVVDDLAGFNGTIGSTYDIVSSASYITTNGLSVTSLVTANGITGFDASIVTVGSNEVLRLTAIPEPSVISMIALFGGGVMFFRRKFMI